MNLLHQSFVYSYSHTTTMQNVTFFVEQKLVQYFLDTKH